MVNDFDTESFASYFSDPYDECGYMELELKRSQHIKNNTVGDLPTRYHNHLKWSNSSMARDVERALNLVPETFGISVRDLKLLYHDCLSPMNDRKIILGVTHML